MARPKVGLTWTAATDNVGVTGYTILRNGAPIGTLTTAATSYTDTGLSVGLPTYTYTVTAHDVVPEHSAASGAVNVDGAAPTRPRRPRRAACG